VILPQMVIGFTSLISSLGFCQAKLIYLVQFPKNATAQLNAAIALLVATEDNGKNCV